jgi:3-phenylpropionate/cinnamic acid dioxygenase small subunit
LSVRGLILALLMTTQAKAAAPRLTEPQVRAFVERQSRAWNAGDLAAYFATFAPEARFTDQALSNENKLVPYGVSSLAQARAQTRKTLAKSKVRETSTVTAVTIAPDGKTARVTARTVSDIAGAAAARRVCAVRVETVALTPAGLRSTGQTDTIVRCRAGAIR